MEMGFGMATNRVSDPSEVFYFFRKKKKSGSKYDKHKQLFIESKS